MSKNLAKYKFNIFAVSIEFYLRFRNKIRAKGKVLFIGKTRNPKLCKNLLGIPRVRFFNLKNKTNNYYASFHVLSKQKNRLQNESSLLTRVS